MNWFVISGGILWLCGAGWYWDHGNWRMSVVSLAYAVSQFALAGVK